MLEQVLSSRYKILYCLGSGGFGQTFLAEDLHLPDGFKCVVKQLKPKMSHPDSLAVARNLFNREALVLHRLGNHHLVPSLYAHFEENQEFYLVQEFIEGQDLSQELLNGKQFSQDYVLELLQNILEALNFVHQQNVIHRDIKPSNLIRRRQDGKIVVIDFGAVKEVSVQTINSSGHTSLTVAIGSPGYMPNEQYSGRPRFCSDIYAVGMIGIQALTGITPSKLPEDTQTGEVSWQNLLQTPISPRLAEVLEKMTYYDFRQRYQSIPEVLQALETIAPSCPSTIVYSPPQDIFPIAATEIAATTLPPPSSSETITIPELQISTPSSQQPTDPVDTSTLQEIGLRSWTRAAIAVSSIFILGSAGSYAYNQWQIQQRVQSVLTQARGLKDQSQYQNCVNQARLIGPQSKLYREAQTLIEECQVSQAKQLATQGKFKEAIAIASRIPASSSLHLVAKQSLEQWATKLLEQATEQYNKGQLQQAIALTQSIPRDLPIRNKAQQQVIQWQRVWDQNERYFKTAQDALSQKNPQRALVEAKKITKTPYWEKRITEVTQKAIQQLQPSPVGSSPPILNNPDISDPINPPITQYDASRERKNVTRSSATSNQSDPSKTPAPKTPPAKTVDTPPPQPSPSPPLSPEVASPPPEIEPQGCSGSVC